MTRVLTTAIAALALGLGVVATSQESARIVDVRIGSHPEFDRLVLEFDRPVEVAREPSAPLGPLVLEFAAKPLLPRQQLDSHRPRMGRLLIEETPRGARVSAQPGARRVRVFLLRNPARLVVDFADPSPDPFDPPEGVRLIVAAPSLPPEPAGPPIAAEPSESVETPEPVEIAEPAPPVALPEPPAPLPADPQTVDEPAHVLPPTEPPPAEPPLPRPDGRRLGRDQLALGLAVLGLAAAALFWAARRRRSMRVAASSRSELAGSVRSSPDSISPEELEVSRDRVEILEKRLDDEVRARMRLEERAVQLHEDLKVVRDRLHRALRRSESRGQSK